MANNTTEMKNSGADVLIGGKVYRLSGAEPEYLHNVAAFLNRKLAEIKKITGYKNLDASYKGLLLNLNIADEYFKALSEAEGYKKELSEREGELYTARYDLVSLKLKLENALKQEEILEKRFDELKKKYEEAEAKLNEYEKEDKEPDIKEYTDSIEIL